MRTGFGDWYSDAPAPSGAQAMVARQELDD